MTSRNAIRRSVPMSALPEFTPVPRKVQRHDGWTPERQRAFIEALADTGCVAIAARMVNMSQPSVYQLRRQPGAESFRAAMDAAQTLGLQVVKDEAFDRAMNGETIPVFVAGKLMGFRRKKNDRLLMFILRHYGQDASGRRTTINYFSTRATAAAQTPPRDGEGERACEAGPGGLLTAQPDAQHRLALLANGGGGSAAVAASEASTTTVKTVITGDNAPSQLAADQSAANALNAFEGAELDTEAQAQIHRALTQCAERRRALADDPENDPERFFIGEGETNGYLGQLESGIESDWVEYRPEGEHLWENLGEGGQAAEIDKVLAGMAERKAEARQADDRQRDSAAEASARDGPGRLACAPDLIRGDRTNVTGFTPVTAISPGLVERVEGLVDAPTAAPEIPPSKEPAPAKAGQAPVPEFSPNSGAPTPTPRKPYKKRQPKPAFTPPDEARKAEAVAAVETERRELADVEADRRRAKAHRA